MGRDQKKNKNGQRTCHSEDAGTLDTKNKDKVAQRTGNTLTKLTGECWWGRPRLGRTISDARDIRTGRVDEWRGRDVTHGASILTEMFQRSFEDSWWRRQWLFFLSSRQKPNKLRNASIGLWGKLYKNRATQHELLFTKYFQISKNSNWIKCQQRGGLNVEIQL